MLSNSVLVTLLIIDFFGGDFVDLEIWFILEEFLFFFSLAAPFLLLIYGVFLLRKTPENYKFIWVGLFINTVFLLMAVYILLIIFGPGLNLLFNSTSRPIPPVQVR